MDVKENAKVWLYALIDSLRADLRIEGKHKLADKIREKMEIVGIKCNDISLNQLKEYKEAYKIHRNMPDASFMELEMF